jgi:hypothetical protein
MLARVVVRARPLNSLSLSLSACVRYFWEREAFRSLGTEVFADTKEITESVGAFRAALKVLLLVEHHKRHKVDHKCSPLWHAAKIGRAHVST